MLSDLEARLEDLLSDISHMPEDYVAKAEKVWYSSSSRSNSSSRNKKRARLLYAEGRLYDTVRACCTRTHAVHPLRTASPDLGPNYL